jgi:hygromycin-B 7''-O-kinase
MHGSIMTSRFPSVQNQSEYEPLSRNEAVLRPGIDAMCDVLGLVPTSLRRYADGSLPVYAVGDSRVLKVYPPFDIPARDTESTVLQAVDGRLSIPTPGVRAVGELDGWGYLLMDQLHGGSLAEAWPHIPAGDRLRLAGMMGEFLAEFHSLRDARLGAVRVDWPGFIEEQRGTAVERQRRRGLEASWLDGISGFLDRTPLGDVLPESLLHTEVMREHLLVERTGEGWRLSGLFDFEPAMVGAPEYEFASVGLFLTCGDPNLLRRVLLSYGYAAAALNEALEYRLLAYGLLHRYSNLPWFLKRVPPPVHVRTLPELASVWWGLR